MITNAIAHGSLWPILLAGGDGTRVSGLTRDRRGEPVPKQFWEADGTPSMLQMALGRVARLVPTHHIVASVSTHHYRWWGRQLGELQLRNLAVQPENRGTAVGILYSLLTILEQDRHALILALPSDHVVEREDVLHQTLVRAVAAARSHGDRIVLVGARPEDSVSEYGWLLPTRGPGPVVGVAAFVEKPDPGTRDRLMAEGALINTFIFAARAEALLDLFLKSVPGVVGPFLEWLRRDGGRWTALETLYRTLPPCDFSRDVLERNPESLVMLPLPACGWSDLGTAERLLAYLDGHAPETRARIPVRESASDRPAPRVRSA